jgi:hypothetical protein
MFFTCSRMMKRRAQKRLFREHKSDSYQNLHVVISKQEPKNGSKVGLQISSLLGTKRIFSRYNSRLFIQVKSNCVVALGASFSIVLSCVYLDDGWARATRQKKGETINDNISDNCQRYCPKQQAHFPRHFYIHSQNSNKKKKVQSQS